MTGDMYNPRLNVATNEDLITALWGRLESGTIKGEVVEVWHPGGFAGEAAVVKKAIEDGIYLLIGPVSDGGSET